MDMKRVISIVLTAAILLGLIATGVTVALAATYIDKVDISGVTVEACKPLPTAITTGEYGTVESVTWEKWDFGTMAWVSATGNAEDGNAYRIIARIKAADDYELNTYVDYSINGQGDYSYAYGDGSYVDVEHSFPVGLTVVGQIELESEPVVEDGKASAQALTELKLPADAPCTIHSAQWHQLDAFTNTDTLFAGTFEKGEIYLLRFKLAPKPGYWFEEDPDVLAENLRGSGSYTDGINVWVELQYNLNTMVDLLDVSVSGGEKGAPVADLEVTVDSEIPFTIDLTVVDPNGVPATGNLDALYYDLTFEVTVPAGYSFGDDLEVNVNGKYYSGWFYNLATTTVEYRLDFRTVIEKVEITTNLQRGMDAADLKVTLPEGANYGLDWNYFIDADYNLVSAGKLEEYTYAHDVSLESKEGYCFDEAKTQVFYNGKDVTDEFYVSSDNSFLSGMQEYFFGDYVSKVELPALTAPKAGDPVPGDIEKAHGENYGYDITWIQVKDGIMSDAGATVEDDSIYGALVTLFPGSKQKFAEDVVVMIGDRQFTGSVMSAGMDRLMLIKLFPVGDAKLVQRVDVTAAQPTAGKAPGTISGGGTGYTFNSGKWGVGKGDDSGIKEPGATFQVGDHVYMRLDIQLENGYLFDQEAKVRLNGKDYDVNWYMTGSDQSGNYKLTVYIGELKAATNPNTGDETPVAALALLTVASVLGMALVMKRRRV